MSPMSITGSLVGYENNNSNDSGKKKRRSILLNTNINSSSSSSNNSRRRSTNNISSNISMGKNCPPSLNSSISNSVITNASSSHSHGHSHSHSSANHHNHQQKPLLPTHPQQQQQQHFPQQYMNSKRKHANNYHNMLMHPAAHLDNNNYLHLNSLWSIWYGVLLTLFQGYLAVHGAYRFLGCSLISWKIEPVAELNLQIVLSGVVFILLPLFFTSAVFKVGNLANDGIKLATGSKERRCSMSPHDGLEEESRGGTLRALWTHGGPTAAFVHIVIAMCLLLPRLLLEARIIENGLLPRENIWQTELDFIAVNRRNLVVLSVITAPYQNITNLDDEEDYYNDTMFTAVSGGGGVNNNLLENTDNMLSLPGRAATATGKNLAKSKAAVVGKTGFFEAPDLINKGSNEQQSHVDDNDINDDNNDDDDVGNGSNSSANNSDISEFGSAAGGRKESLEHTYDGGGIVVVGGRDERIIVQHFDSQEFLDSKLSKPLSTTTTTTSAVTTTITTTDTTTSKPTKLTPAATTTTTQTISTATVNNVEVPHKNYDKLWDKLGTLGKVNTPGADEDMVDLEDLLSAGRTTMYSTSISTESTMKTTSNKSTNKAATLSSTSATTTLTQATSDELQPHKATNTTTKAAVAAAATSTTTLSAKTPTAKITNHKAKTTTTTTATSDSSLRSRSNANKKHVDDVEVVDSSTVATPVAPHTQPTRTHHHHQHQQQQQQQHHHHTHSAAGKSTRKHHNNHNGNGNGNRQHHRQRGQHHHQHQNHHRRHHSNNARNSEETRLARNNADLRPSSTVRAVDLNRLDESSLPSLDVSTFYEQSGSATGTAGGANKMTGTGNDELDALDYERRALFPKSTSTISTTTRDSNIHIVKPEMLPEIIIPSTPLTSNSKIIEIKTKGAKRAKRMADDEMKVEIEPEYLIGDLSDTDNVTSGEQSDTSATSARDEVTSNANAPQQPQLGLVRLDGFAGMLQIFFGIEKPIDVTVFEHPPSAEFVNLLFALLVWCVRYPAVFWTTTKTFATIFSIQMIAAAMDIVFSYIGTSNLYKLQVYAEAQPIQNPGLILNGVVTLALFLLSTVLMIASSMIMYLYGHGRLAAKMRDRSLITMKSSETWIYFAHCASLCYVLALAVVKAPLLNDLSATYKNNLHCPTFLSALISVVHLLLWIVIWLGLTAKRRWTFKLPPMDTFGITKATTQPLLMANRGSLPSASSGSGSGSGSGANVGLATDQKGSSLGGGGGGGILSTASSTDGGVDDVYWPKLTPSSPKLKVTFNEVPSTSDDVLLIGDHEQNDGKRHSPRGAAVCFTGAAGEIDDGEYATLRAATAATVVGISMGSMSSSSCATVVGSIAMVTAATTTATSNTGNGFGDTNSSKNINENGTPTPTPTGSIGIMNGMKMLQLSEYDELPPPPPPQLMPMTSNTINTINGVNCNIGNVSGNGSGSGNTAGNLQAHFSAHPQSTFGDYANFGINGGGNGFANIDDNISEEGKLLDCVRDDSVTYASTRDLEPPQTAVAAGGGAGAPPPPPPPPLGATTALHSPTHMGAASVAHIGSNGLHRIGIGGRAPQALPENMQLSSSPEHLVSPLAPVTVTVHSNEAHIASSSTPRCLRRADSGVPNEALTPRSDTTSTTESTTSPPERAPSESSSGVHSGEERDVEVVIRPRAACKPPPKPPQPPIQEEPYGRCTNMRMSSFGGDIGTAAAAAAAARNASSATLPLTRSAPEQKFDYANHCSTMPLPAASHSSQQQQLLQQQQSAGAVGSRGSGNYTTTSAHCMQQSLPNNSLSSFRSPYANSAVAMAGANAARLQQEQSQQQQINAVMHTTLPNGVRYSNPNFLRRLPHVSKAADSPYGHLGLGAGHHTFSKLLQDPLQSSLVNTTIPEDRDSANYSMSSEHECNNMYATAQHYN